MYYLSLLVIIMSFIMGLLEILFGISPSYSGFAIDLTVLILFGAVLLKGKASNFPYFGYIMLFIIFSLISKSYNKSSNVELVLGFKRYVLPILFIYVVANIRISDNQFIKFNRLLLLLLILQIPFAFIKLSIYGFGNESSLIGTIANSGGSISTVLPMLGASVFLTLYLYKHNKIYLFLIIGIFFFGIVGGKRAVIFYTPISLLITYILHKYSVESKRKLFAIIKRPKVVFLWGFLFFIILYAGVRLNPTFNPEDKVGGSFNVDYAIQYIMKYENRNNYSSNQKYQLEGTGRMNALAATFNYLTYQKPYSFVLTGIGPGTLEKSLYNSGAGETFEDIGLGYGVSIIGVYRTFIQFGLIALLFLVIFYYKIIKKFVVYAIHNSTVSQKYFVIALAWSYLLLIDFLTYSQAIIGTRAFYFSFYFLIGYAINVFYKQQRLNKIIERKL